MGGIAGAIFTALQLLVNKGLLYCIASSVCYIYLKLTSRISGHRFQLYDYSVEDDPEKVSFFAAKSEYDLESPQGAVHLKKNADSVFFMGVNSLSESLTVQISRKPNSQVQCSLVLRLSDGRTYYLPTEHSIQPAVDESLTFGTSRLKLQCLSPMRRWRIFFNGTLREMGSDTTTEPKYRHVKFAILWTASSGAFDYTNDMCPSILSDVAATQGSWLWPPVLFMQRLKSIFNSYEQCGMMLGTVTVEGDPEKEIYLWGCRGRYLGGVNSVEEGDFEDIYVNSKNGSFIHLGILNLPGMLKNFIYGFVLRPNGHMFPIEKCIILEDEDNLGITKKYRCFSESEEYTIKVVKESSKLNFSREYNGESFVTHAAAFLNVMKGRSLLYKGKIQPSFELAPRKKLLFSTKSSVPPTKSPILSVPFHDPYCQLLEVSGGKGSSLAKLCVISDQLKCFTVPNGIVVTTSAYQSFIQGDLTLSLEKFEKNAWKLKTEELIQECQRLVDEISRAQLPVAVKKSVEANLLKLFGKDYGNLKFAVRSSATGEDTEQMSAAGQMETFLGRKGLTEILDSLKKCWASQFSHIAVEYKRRYGQLLNTPMAVVIQEMVPCDAAGVIFTCDPVTGNPAYVSITANYGLGESVVAASVDPDTVTLSRNEYNDVSIYSKSAGKKKSKIVMDDTGGTREIHVEEDAANEYCINQHTALFLGEIAVKIEEIFGNPRDIEWGVLNGKIYLFQSRPVTSLDIETDFEIKHSFDNYLRREDEYLSTANVAEVMPGAASPLGLYMLMNYMDVAMKRTKYISWDGIILPKSPYFVKRFMSIQNHLMVYVSDSPLRMNEQAGEDISDHTKAISVAIFGRVIEDEKIYEMARDRHRNSKKFEPSIVGKVYIIFLMFFTGYSAKKTAKKYTNFVVPVNKSNPPSETLMTIAVYLNKISELFNSHFANSMISATWNQSVLSLLSKVKGDWDNDVFGDFGYLLSTISQVESADVPSSLQSLGFSIAQCMEPEEFKKMTTEEALDYLQKSSSEAGLKFRDFLKKHGHRCLKELDVYSTTWGQDPKLLVKMLQGFVSKDSKDSVAKKTRSFNAILPNLKVKLDFFGRLKLRFLLPRCQRGVREREISKSHLVRNLHQVRLALNTLADTMIQEGRLPHRDLLFFMDPEEIRQLIETRSPRLVAKAFRRWRCHGELDKMIFPEIMIGIPKPINMDENIIASAEGFTLTGVPVSHGVIKGTARVVLNLSDANQIQHGDILITHATDIGWSPYFALLSGVATELGGLISHGAVVAREYGLPCVVNLQGASRHFQSGDTVILDGNLGFLKKVENTS